MFQGVACRMLTRTFAAAACEVSGCELNSEYKCSELAADYGHAYVHNNRKSAPNKEAI